MTPQQFLLSYNGPKILINSGGVAAGLAELIRIPGCSRILSGLNYLYDETSYNGILGEVPSKYVSQEAADTLSQALIIGDQDNRIIIGVTGAYTTNRERRGEEQIFACFRYKGITGHLNFKFSKGEFSRPQQDTIITEWLLDQIYEFSRNL